MNIKAKISADLVDNNGQGAHFRIRVETTRLKTVEETLQVHREVVGALDAFCDTYFIGDHDWDRNEGAIPFEEWLCEDEAMLYKYWGLAGDWSDTGIIISNRDLAARFRKQFCAEN